MTDIYSAFTGNIPQNYDHYLGPIFFHRCAEDLAVRIAAGQAQQVLEIAAGTGIASRYLRNQLPGKAHITVSDLNDDMLRYAKQKFSSEENISFKVADAMALPFEDGQFDVIACQFGIMFCANKLQTFHEAHRVLRRGGRLLFSIWDALEHNPLPQVTNEVLAEIFDGDAPAFLQLPFSYHDQTQIRKDMEKSGFSDVQFNTINSECAFSQPKNAALGMVTGSPLRLEIEQRGDISIDDVVDKVMTRLKSKFGERNCRVPMRWTVMSANRPV